MGTSSVNVTFLGNPVTLLGETAVVGQVAPDFTALDQSLTPRKLSEFAGKAIAVLVYPSIDTGICASTNRRFNQEAANLGDVAILSVSVDLPFAQKRFCAAEGIDKVITLSDHRELDFGLKYGFAIEGLRLLARGILIINKEGVITYVEYVPEIASDPDYDAALKALKELV